MARDENEGPNELLHVTYCPHLFEGPADVAASKALSWEGDCRDIACGALDVRGIGAIDARASKRLSWEGGWRDMACRAIDVEASGP